MFYLKVFMTLTAVIVGVGLAFYTNYNRETPQQNYYEETKRHNTSNEIPIVPVRSDNTQQRRLSRKEKRKYSVDDEDSCIICLELLEDQFTHILECDHIFHMTCITRWMRENKKNCPICRRDINA